MRVLLCVGSWLGATVLAHAQVLPVPNARNSDWVLEKAWVLDATTLGPRASWPETFGARDLMPNADSTPQGKESVMPNAPTTSLSSDNTTIVKGQHYYWDAARQLSYKWPARRGQIAPDSLVTVRQPATGVTFTYRKRSRPEQGYPRN